MMNNPSNFVKLNRKNPSSLNSGYTIGNWLVFDLEWKEDANTKK